MLVQGQDPPLVVAKTALACTFSSVEKIAVPLEVAVVVG